MHFVRATGLLLGACLVASPLAAQPSPIPANCDIHFYPAERLHSVGEDFDAVKRVDQDLRDYDALAGRRLDWLNVERQLALLDKDGLATLLGTSGAAVTAQAIPLKRSQALAPGPHVAAPPACLVEVMAPQLWMERGGLAKRSLRLFGVVRRYQAGKIATSYSGFAVAMLPGFRLKTPDDASAATAQVERAYTEAVRSLVIQSLANSKSK